MGLYLLCFSNQTCKPVEFEYWTYLIYCLIVLWKLTGLVCYIPVHNFLYWHRSQLKNSWVFSVQTVRQNVICLIAPYRSLNKQGVRWCLQWDLRFNNFFDCWFFQMLMNAKKNWLVNAQSAIAKIPGVVMTAPAMESYCICENMIRVSVSIRICIFFVIVWWNLLFTSTVSLFIGKLVEWLLSNNLDICFVISRMFAFC